MSAVNPQADPERGYRNSLHAALAELDALRANYAAMHEAHALTARQKRNAEDRLAAVEKVRDNLATAMRLGGDAGHVIDGRWILRRLVDALGAAGSQGQSGENPKDTPTPQETCGDGQPWPGRICELPSGHKGKHDPPWPPVTSTPEAATEPQEESTRLHRGHFGWTATPSGLQRATEQQQ